MERFEIKYQFFKLRILFFVDVTIQDFPRSQIRISNTSCSLSPFTRLKMLIWGGEALLGPNV